MEELENLHKKPNEKTVWKMGVFYFDKNDQRIFPPKQSGGGWTINFANPYSIIVNAGIIGLPFIFALLVSSQAGFKSHRYDKGGVKTLFTDSSVVSPD